MATAKPTLRCFFLLLIPALVKQKFLQGKKQNLKKEIPLLTAAGFADLGSDGASYCDWDYGWVLNVCHRQVMLLYKQVIQPHIPEPTVLH